MGHTRLGSTLTQTWMNQILADIERLSRYAGGRGVLTGLALSIGTGLEVDIADGVILGEKATALTGIGPATLPASVTRYIWINEGGTILLTATDADPGGTYACLGRATSGASAITSVEENGRVDLLRYESLREITVGRHVLFHPKGAVREGHESFTIAAGGSYSINAACCPTNLYAEPGGAGCKVILPTPEFGMVYRVFNSGAAQPIALRNETDTATIATINAGNNYTARPLPVTGSPGTPTW